MMPLLGKTEKQNLTLFLIRLEQIRVINIWNNPIIFRTVLVLIKNQNTISASIFFTTYTLVKIISWAQSQFTLMYM